MIKEVKLQQLEESYRQGGEGNSCITFKEWVEQESENDPHFFAWLFDAELDDDFDTSLSDEQREEFKEFMSNL